MIVSRMGFVRVKEGVTVTTSDDLERSSAWKVTRTILALC